MKYVVSNEKKNFSKNKIFIFFLILSLAFFLPKWLISYFYFPNEDLTFKIISDSHKDSYYYFHYIKSLSNLSFNNLFLSNITSPNLMPIPYGSIIFHTILFKIIGISSFIVLEYVCVFIFLYVFYLIFLKLNFKNNFSILLASFFLCLPLIFSLLGNIGIAEIRTFSDHFYNLRFPRPLIANLFFFIFIYLMLISVDQNPFDLKIIILFSLILALSFSSFFFIFVIQAIAFFLFLITNYKNNIFFILKTNLRNIFIALITFTIIIIPFIFLILNADEDYSNRLGLFEINYEDKKFLLSHYVEKIFRIKMIFVYVFLLTTFLIIKSFFKNDFKKCKIFYIIFISSLLAPILFIFASNRVAFLYHFNNMIVISTLLLLIIILLIFVKQIVNKFNFFENRVFVGFFISIFLIIFNFKIYQNFENPLNKFERLESNKIIEYIGEKKIDISKLNLLTLNSEFMTWGLLKGINNLTILDGTFSVRSDNLQEKSLIQTFKFLNLSKNDFIKFLENKKIGYRYINIDARIIFWQKYQANSIFTFKRSKNFDIDVLEFILKSSPFYAHQFAIPNDELVRLHNKFDVISNEDFLLPDLIIIKKNHNIFKSSLINDSLYCKLPNLDNIVFLKKDFCIK